MLRLLFKISKLSTPAEWCVHLASNNTLDMSNLFLGTIFRVLDCSSLVMPCAQCIVRGYASSSIDIWTLLQAQLKLKLDKNC